MLALDVAVKTLKESVRQPKNLAITLGLPVAFMLIFGFAFGGADATTYRIAVMNEDEGDLGASYLEGLEGLAYGNGEPMTRLMTVASEEEALAGIESGGRYHAFLRVPANFSANMQRPEPEGTGPLPQVGFPQGPPPMPPGSVVALSGDPASIEFNGASQVVAAYTQAFAERASGFTPVVKVETRAVTSSELTPFDRIAPGLMVFAVLNLAPQAAATLARETEIRTIDRIRASPARALSILGGVTAAQLVLAAVSLSLMLVTARLMGFQNQGSYVTALGVVLASALAVLGIGLIIASFVKLQQEAANLGVLVSVPASFLSGAFFDLPAVNVGTWGGRSWELYDVLPTTHAVDALESVMTFGNGADAVAGSLVAIVVLAGLYFAAGVALFRRTRLAPE